MTDPISETAFSPTPAAPAAPMATEKLPCMTDEELVQRVRTGRLPPHALELVMLAGENASDDVYVRAVHLRRQALIPEPGIASDLPLSGLQYEQVFGHNCENVVGHVPIPVGLAGPLNVNGTLLRIPLATTEGGLVASINRGCKAVTVSGGASAVVTASGMTRAPVVALPHVQEAYAFRGYVTSPEGWAMMSDAFGRTTNFGSLKNVSAQMAGRHVYLRFKCDTGDAMGMNMCTKGVQAVLDVLRMRFPRMEVLALSGNTCADKKPAAINWVEGRGHSMVAECILPPRVVEDVLKSSVTAMVNANVWKNLVGSAVAGSIGGFNAHAANVAAAMYLACGQDPAQVVEASHCLTTMEAVPPGGYGNPNSTPHPNAGEGPWLHVTVSCPALCVGTVGGGTRLAAQQSCLRLLNACGASDAQLGEPPGTRSVRLAGAVVSTILAGELSLMAALSTNTLVEAHLRHGRNVAAHAFEQPLAPAAAPAPGPANMLLSPTAPQFQAGPPGMLSSFNAPPKTTVGMTVSGTGRFFVPATSASMMPHGARGPQGSQASQGPQGPQGPQGQHVMGAQPNQQGDVCPQDPQPQQQLRSPVQPFQENPQGHQALQAPQTMPLQHNSQANQLAPSQQVLQVQQVPQTQQSQQASQMQQLTTSVSTMSVETVHANSQVQEEMVANLEAAPMETRTEQDSESDSKSEAYLNTEEKPDVMPSFDESEAMYTIPLDESQFTQKQMEDAQKAAEDIMRRRKAVPDASEEDSIVSPAPGRRPRAFKPKGSKPKQPQLPSPEPNPAEDDDHLTVPDPHLKPRSKPKARQRNANPKANPRTKEGGSSARGSTESDVDHMGVYVRNVPDDVTAEELASCFTGPWGTPQRIDTPGRNMAFLHFETPEQAQAVLQGTAPFTLRNSSQVLNLKPLQRSRARTSPKGVSKQASEDTQQEEQGYASKYGAKPKGDAVVHKPDGEAKEERGAPELRTKAHAPRPRVNRGKSRLRGNAGSTKA